MALIHKLTMEERMDGRTDKHDHVYRTITFNKSCNVLNVNPSGKTAYSAKRMPKQNTISNSNSISILRIPSTNSRHNGKCIICAFHEEIHIFEDWIFVRLSSRFLSSEWTTNRNKFIVESIDFDRFMTSEGSYPLILPFTSKTGQSVAKNRQKIFIICILLGKRGCIWALYRPNFRLQT